MKIAFSGCRDYAPSVAEIRRIWAWFVSSTLFPYAQKGEQVEVLVGDANGVDAAIHSTMSDHYAVSQYRANWKQHGNRAGPIRNKAMIDDADALIAFWDGKSPGTKNCIKCATDKGIPVLIMPVKNTEEAR